MPLLASLDLVKRVGRIRDAADDRLLTELIEGATSRIQQLTQRRLFEATQVEVRDGHGRPSMMMRERPVSAVSSVRINGAEVPARVSYGQAGFFHDTASVHLSGRVFTAGMGNVEITYTAGYASIPWDLQVACAEMVIERLKGIDRLGISSKSLAGEHISYMDGSAPPTALSVIETYRSVVAP